MQNATNALSLGKRMVYFAASLLTNGYRKDTLTNHHAVPHIAARGDGNGTA